MACAICETRRPRRFCPGVRGDICTLCCGTEREETVACPLDCEYLREARRHEAPSLVGESEIPHSDVRVTEDFLGSNQELLLFIGQTIAASALATEGVVDSDVREALDALVRTLRTLESGVYYETVPSNPLAATVYQAVQRGAAQYREQERERLGMSKTRDRDLLGLAVFLSRLAADRNNGRRRGRSFLAFLDDIYRENSPAISSGAGSSLLLP